MIKKLVIIFFLSNNIYAQDTDSIFWFDTKALKNNPPEFPLVINKVLTGNHLFIIDSLKQLKNKINEGYRIQIFESTVSSIARAEAKRFQNILGDSVYIYFEAPLYKLRIGNFIERKNAERAIETIERLGAKDAWIIRTKIDLK
jgi:Sporulation related domain.